jgi:Ca2+-binding RTX toxin-like protein
VTSGGSVAENAAAGTRVATLAAKDVDDHAVSYAITDAEGNRVTDARFEIVGNKIQVRAGASLDWEAAQSHTLYVRASDQFASSAPSKIVIGVTDRAEVIQLAAGGAVFTEAGVTEISVRGGSGNDRLTGGAKSDALSGGAGQDTIEGGAGSDRLEGGAGQDTLTGGTGADDFIFASVRHSAPGSDSRDVIVGFSKGSDDIVVSSIDARRGVPGDQAFCLDTNDSFSAGEIRQKVTSKGLLIEFNTDSDAAAEMAILVQGLTSQLSASDFLL